MFSLALNFLPAASLGAEKFESFYTVFLWIGTIIFVCTLGVGIYWAIRYKRRTENDKVPYIPHNYLVEFCSIFFISIWVAVFFLWGWHDYSDFISPKPDEYEINVIGQQWNWQIQYQHGKTFTNELFVPRGRPVKLVMTSKDVLHSFFIPEFRVKADTVPGQFTTLRFQPTKVGLYNIFCAEYCGTSHSKMIGKVHVMEPEDFQKWIDGVYKVPVVAAEDSGQQPAAPLSMAELGAGLYKSKTCYTCHSLDGSRLYGPSFKGLWGSEQELMNGEKVAVDENYIRESIMDPMKKIVKGYPPQMPVFRGMLTDEEVNQLIAYMKTLK